MSKVVIIAEAGVNHNGSLEMACRLADEAKHAGADYVKFQTGIPENVISVRAEQAEYQKHNTGTSESQLDMVRKIMLRPDDFKPLKEYCDSIGIRFLSTPFDLDSIDILKPLEMNLWKIPSGEITNLPYLRKIASMGQPVVMSTGMSRLGEVDDAVGVLLDGGLTLDMITLLHCNTEYPTPYTDVNLRAMLTLRDAIGCRVGYSDHTLGIEVPVAAVAMGAEVIEKHFTLDKTLPGPDHVASLEPAELKAMVSAIRHTEAALGSGRIMAAMWVHCKAIFSIANRHSLMNSSFSNKSWGIAPQMASSGKRISSAWDCCAFCIAAIILVQFPWMSPVL